MRTLLGITLRNNETSMFDPTSTAVVAIPMPIPFSTDLVTANVGHNPSTNRNGGISFQSPLVNS
jgi:hypothetical protein